MPGSKPCILYKLGFCYNGAKTLIIHMTNCPSNERNGAKGYLVPHGTVAQARFVCVSATGTALPGFRLAIARTHVPSTRLSSCGEEQEQFAHIKAYLRLDQFNALSSRETGETSMRFDFRLRETVRDSGVLVRFKQVEHESGGVGRRRVSRQTGLL